MSYRKPTHATLTEQQVAQAKRRLLQGEAPRKIADDLKVGAETIRRISRGEAWTWVSPAKAGAR